MRLWDRLTLAAGIFSLGLLASGAGAQEPVGEQFGPWTVAQGSSACVASSDRAPFPDGVMPPWEYVELLMSEPQKVAVRYTGRIAPEGPAGEHEGQAVMGNQGEPPEYFFPKIVIADHADAGRKVTAYIEGEAYDAMRVRDYFLLRAGEQMLPVGLTPDPEALFDALASCAERLPPRREAAG